MPENKETKLVEVDKNQIEIFFKNNKIQYRRIMNRFKQSKSSSENYLHYYFTCFDA